MNANEKKVTIECVRRDPNHPSVNEFRVSAIPDYEFADYQMGVKTPNHEPLEWRVSSSFRFSIIAAAFPNQV